MTRTTIALAALTAALALPAAAAAKGASSASLQGPNLNHAIALNGDGEDGNTPLGRLAGLSGIFPQLFGQRPETTLKTKPRGYKLGPRYTVRYAMPGENGTSSIIRQDVYPYALPDPVTYVRPGQQFFGTMHAPGGWYVSPSLKTVLVQLGLPESAPAGGGFSIDTGLLAGLAAAAAALVLLILAAMRLRRRPRPVIA